MRDGRDPRARYGGTNAAGPVGTRKAGRRGMP